MTSYLTRPARLKIAGDRTSRDFRGQCIDDGQSIRGNPRFDERDGKFVRDVLHSDNASFRHLRVENFRGAGFVLGRTADYTSGLDAYMPVCERVTAFRGYAGIVQEAVDWMIDHPTIAGMVHVGIEFIAGACACDGGQVYGCDIGGLVRSPDVALNGTEFSDSRVGLRTCADSQLTGVYSERCEETNIHIGARATLTNLVVKTKAFVGNAPHTPTAVAFEYAPDSTPNWAIWSVGLVDELKPGYTGIRIDAHLLQISKVHISGDIAADGLVIGQPVRDGYLPPERVDVDVTICGPRVVIRSIGQGSTVRISYHTVKPQFVLPSEWPSNSKLIVNDVEQAPGRAA